MARKYEQKRRAEQREETRRRISEAAVELHETVGPARATISAIAEGTGVQRLTVYHFPDERSLFSACTEHYLARHPPPDPAPWTGTAYPEVRLTRALAELYAYYRRTEPMSTNSVRDAPVKPVISEVLMPSFEHRERMRQVLAVGWDAPEGRRELVLAAIGHALDFQTWRSLVRQQGLDDEQSVNLLVCSVRCAARG